MLSRTSGDGTEFGLIKAFPTSTAAVYETEGHRFESCRLA
jgi:hypothetical protein